MSLMFQPLVKYADFEGRARRSEYWLFTLFLWIVGLVALVLIAAAAAGDESGGAAGGVIILVALASLAVFLPSLAVTIRRLHDIDKSGWWILIGLLPLVGGLILFIFSVMDGTRGPNRFGPDPKAREPYVARTEVHHYHHGAALADPAADTQA